MHATKQVVEVAQSVAKIDDQSQAQSQSCFYCFEVQDAQENAY